MFEDYSKAIIEIDGYNVVIIDKARISLLLNDKKFVPVWDIVIQRALEIDYLEIGFVYIPRYAEKFQWFPVLLYYFDSGLEFVWYAESWKCKDCGYLTDWVLLHQVYHESFYTPEELNKILEKINTLFPLRRCPKCNKILQGKPILLQNK